MLDDRASRLIYAHAHVPEHLPAYVQGVSGAEPFLWEGYLCYVRDNRLTFVAYPIEPSAPDPPRACRSARKRFRPAVTAIIAPEIWLRNTRLEDAQRDHYFRLDLPLSDPPAEAAYMVRRAAREVTVSAASYGEEHDALVRAFLNRRDLSEGHRKIFSRISHYLRLSKSARLLEARKDRKLAAFSIVDLGSEHYGFYLFNFRSTKINVPGASDLILFEMATLAHAQGKQALNLGLGTSPGVRRFKLKWGAVPFLPCHSAVIIGTGFDVRTIVETLLSRV